MCRKVDVFTPKLPPFRLLWTPMDLELWLLPEVSAMSYEQAMGMLTRDDRFKATVYAMNTLLIDKGVYSQAEFQKFFVEWATKEPVKSVFIK
jgi:hypothetical protein